MLRMTAQVALRQKLSGPVGAIIVAAGQRTRMSGTDKIFAPVLGKPLIAYSLEAFSAHPLIDEIVLVLSTPVLDLGRELVRRNAYVKVRAVCAGGARRQDSVRNGLAALSPAVRWVVVHDGARPCVTADMLSRGLEATLETGASVASVAVADTIKVVDKSGRVIRTPDRSELWAAQTPQIFSRDVLTRAHVASQADATDDAGMVEALGITVRVFEGSRANIKVTTPEDLLIVEALLRASQARPAKANA